MRRRRAPMRKCEDCGGNEFDCAYEAPRSFAVCCKCLGVYELIECGDDEEEDEEDFDGDHDA